MFKYRFLRSGFQLSHKKLYQATWRPLDSDPVGQSDTDTDMNVNSNSFMYD